MTRNQYAVLLAILECETDELKLLDYIQYDVADIVKHVVANGEYPSLNNILTEVICEGISELDAAVREKTFYYQCKALDAEKREPGVYWKYRKSIERLQSLFPPEDVRWDLDGLNTRVYFHKHEKAYRELLSEEISQIEDHMGFKF